MADPIERSQRRSTRIRKTELNAEPASKKGKTTGRTKLARVANAKASLFQISSDDDSSGSSDVLELPRRTSSRANKFSRSMKEMDSEPPPVLLKNKDASSAPEIQIPFKKSHKRLSEDSFDDSSDSSEDEDDHIKPVSALRIKKREPASPKSPAVRHASRRHRVKTQMPVAHEKSESSDDGDNSSGSDDESLEGVEEEELKIQRIIASRSATREEWRKTCENMNTSEIENGSRWFQEESAVGGDDTFQERFMVKWADLSYLHCSWELEKDLKEQVEGAKSYLSTFFRRSENGLLFDADDRGDGEIFDPLYVQIDRVLEVINPGSDEEEENEDRTGRASRKSKKKGQGADDNWGMVFDKGHPNYEEGTGRQFLIKWCNTSYSDASYEFERDLILNDIEYDNHVNGFLRRRVKPKKEEMKKAFSVNEEQTRRLYKIFGDSIPDDAEKVAKIEEYRSNLEMHVFPNEGQLRDYQAEGVSWLLANHVNKRSSILADEMGLGKTIQTAVYINMVATTLNARGPFLIVAPLSTIPHWQREFTSWTGLNTVVYHGSARDRELIRELEFAFECDRPEGLRYNQSFLKSCHKKVAPKWQKTWMIEVVITTPEMLVTDDFKELSAIRWEVLVVDEAHRLKNHSSKLAVNLRDDIFQFDRTLLLTGTPIQNNMAELWTLMNIVDTNKFYDISEFLIKFGDIKSKSSVDELHDSIRPYILRRLKEDVEKSVPPKEETLIEVELTVLQKQYYRALYEKNVKFLHRNKKKPLDGPSINNLAMQLRKCCNHPFLLRGVEIETRLERPELKSASDEADFIVKASGKLVLLDKLLPKLKEGGHRVLIFSQFKIMLDVLEDYLHYRSFKAERIDGSITGKKRQMAIDRFQGQQGSAEAFIMLLSTRAGGVGINLTAADTCIIFDSDWNPQNDLQAQARCHRIGQSKNVKVYRLLSRKTYEMQMFHMSSLKMGLDQAVLQGIENGATGGVAGELTKEEVERLLRHGAYDIFNEEKNGTSEKESNDFVSQDIESILQRRTKTVIHDNTGSASNAAGSTFSKASFKATSAGAIAEDVDVDDPEFWIKMVGEAKSDDKANLLGNKRLRKLANYNEQDYQRRLQESFADERRDSLSDPSSDSSDSSANVESDEDTSSDDIAFDFSDGAPLKHEALQNMKNESRAKRELQERSRWGGKSPHQWAERDVNIVLMYVLDYGYGNVTWEDLVRKCSAEMSKSYHQDEVKRMCWSLVLLALRKAVDEDVRDIARRAKREAEKKRELEEASTPPSPNKGGLLANSEHAINGDKTISMKSQVEVSFTKLWNAHMSWASIALKDATDFASAHLPRSNDVINCTIFKRASASNKLKEESSSLLITAFVENVWPALQSRGWKQDIATAGKSSRDFFYGKKAYRSVAAVLDVASTVHPELANTVDSIIHAVANSSQNLVQTDSTQKKSPNISPADVDAQSLSRLLNQHAPLQLMVNRTKSGKLTFPRQMLETLLYLNTAHSLVAKADALGYTQASSISEYYSQLSKILTVSKKAALPHPSWTMIHDSILIRSIVYHGWISRENNWRAIVEDKTIAWGHPFDKGDRRVQVDGTAPALSVASGCLQQNSNEVNGLVTVAKRATAFLNSEEAMLRDLKGFNLKTILTTYCIVQGSHTETDQKGSDSDADKSTGPWKVDEKALRRGTDLTNPVASDSDLEELVSLPSRRDLLKRAKLILSKSSISLSTTAETVSQVGAAGNQPVVKSKSPSNTFSILDQSNARNIFLAELIRYIIKLGPRGRKIQSKLIALAKAEARILLLSVTGTGAINGSSSEANDLKKISEHLELVARHIKRTSRQSKNVLRVILGLEPIPPKNEFDGMFPIERPRALAVAPTTRLANKAPDRKQRDSASGDQAINRAIKIGRLSVDKHSNLSNDFCDHLRLTSMETLLLIVMCSQGLPVYCDDWMLLLNPLARSVTKTPGLEFVTTWYGMGAVVEATAESWLQLAKAKLQKVEAQGLSSDNLSPIERDQLRDDIETCKRDVEVKEKTRDEGKRLKDNSYTLAKRSIMLVEAVRLQMKPKETKSVDCSENGLGSKVLKWVSRHLVQWASVLNIIDEKGRPYSSTGCEFPEVVAAVAFEQKSCRAIYIQLGQQTRLRSLFIKYGKSAMKMQIEMAAQNCDKKGLIWEQRPSWWGRYDGHESRSPFSDDIDLLIGITDYGYGGFDHLLSTHHSFRTRHENSKQRDAELDEISSVFTQASVQVRVNNLTQELSGLDDTAEAVRILTEQKKRKNEKNDIALNGKSSKDGAIQRDINSFFKPSVEQLQDDDSSIEVLDVKYINSNTGSENDVSAKRKSALTNAVASPEKKQKNSEIK